MVCILAGQLTIVAVMADASPFHDVLLKVVMMLFCFAAHSLPSLVSWLGSHTDNVNAAAADDGKGVPEQHKYKSIIAFPINELIEKADGFAGVFPDTYFGPGTVDTIKCPLNAQNSHVKCCVNDMNAPTTNTHHMVTRVKARISKPLACMNCHATTTSPIPRSHLHALRDPNWQKAMVDEYNALISNRMWALVPRPTNDNIIQSMWLFKHKFNADGSLSRYKARLVVNGRNQQQWIDCDEGPFSPVSSNGLLLYVLSLLMVTRDWPILQLDVKVCFSSWSVYTEPVYIAIRNTGFVDSATPDYAFISLLHSELAMTGPWISLLFLWCISQAIEGLGLFCSQSKFAEEILERAHMQHCNSCKTLVDTESKLGSDGDPISDPTLYRSLAGALQYLTFTRPDISYVVQQICLYMHDPRDLHFTALKRILRYVRGTIDHGLQLHVSSTSQCTAYTDVDWVGCPVTRRSTSGYCVFLGDNLLSWSAKQHVTLSRSSAEAEYRGVANVVAKTAWIRNLLLELHTPLSTATIVYCDNVSVVYLSTNPVQHQRTKHIEIDIHFVRDREYVASGQVRVLHVPSRFQYADIFTKGLPTTLFLEFRSSLNVRRSPAHTEREY
ncbi:ribonuclease H-like domain-containing protein [Tanacetum coccineum]